MMLCPCVETNARNGQSKGSGAPQEGAQGQAVHPDMIKVETLPVCGSAAPSADVVAMKIERSSIAENLGLLLWFKGTQASVTALAPDGLVAKYNAACSISERVLVGDRVLNVNGVKGENMLDEIRNATVINIEIVRQMRTLLLKKGRIDEPLGVKLRYNQDNSHCEVTQISAERSVDLDQVAIGDLIVKVNEVEGSANELVGELQSAKELNITILRQTQM